MWGRNCARHILGTLSRTRSVLQSGKRTPSLTYCTESDSGKDSGTPTGNIPQLLVEDLQQVSEFDRNQIAALWQHFSLLAGAKGYLTQEDFAVNFSLMGTMDASICAKYFDLFDRENNHVINFEEFVLGLGQMLKFVESGPTDLPPQIVKEERDAKLIWPVGGPNTCLVIKKWRQESVTDKMLEICEWLTQKGITVYVEQAVHEQEMPQYVSWSPPDGMKKIDFMVCIGGDGTLLHIASLVEDANAIPPVLAFAMGSLGFLTPFDVGEYEECLARVIGARHKNPLYCTLRTRLKCEVWVDGKLHALRRVLNECLIDRGGSPFLSKLDCIIDNHQVTTIQADGLIISTPSGSTAYNTAAGGAMVVPSVSCTLLTPIAPHSLSFRPIVVPDTSTIEIHIPANARANARASFDGRHEVDLPKGSFVRIQTSRRSFPLISMNRYEADWYNSIKSKLKWNVRVEQGSREFEDPSKYFDSSPPPDNSGPTSTPTPSP